MNASTDFYDSLGNINCIKQQMRQCELYNFMSTFVRQKALKI